MNEKQVKKDNKKELLKILERLEKGQEIANKSLTQIEKWQKEQEVQTAFVTSALPLTEEQKKDLRVNLGFIFGKNFQIETRVDSSVIAGLKIQIGSQVIDSTIVSQLEKLKTDLKKLAQ